VQLAEAAPRTRLDWLSPMNGDGYDGMGARRRASNKGFLEISFVEQLELLDALVRRERIEQSGGTSSDIPSVLDRLGVTPVSGSTR